MPSFPKVSFPWRTLFKQTFKACWRTDSPCRFQSSLSWRRGYLFTLLNTSKMWPLKETYLLVSKRENVLQECYFLPLSNHNNTPGENHSKCWLDKAFHCIENQQIESFQASLFLSMFFCVSNGHDSSLLTCFNLSNACPTNVLYTLWPLLSVSSDALFLQGSLSL